MIKRTILILFIFLITLNANDIIELNNNAVSYSNFNIQEYEDKSENLTIRDIQALKDFKSVKNKISKGYTNSTFWYKLTIVNKKSNDEIIYLKMSESYLDKVESYIEVNSNITQVDNKSFSNKPIIPIKLEKDESKIIYIKINTIYPLFVSFDLFDKNSLDKSTYDYNIFYAFIYGAIIALILYNLVIFLYSKDIAYLYYIFYVSSFLVWQIIMNDIPPIDKYINKNNLYTLSSSVPLIVLFMILFSKSILDTKIYLPKLDKILSYLSIVYGLLTLSSIYDFKNTIPITNLFISFTLPFLLFIGLKSLYLKNKTAKFYLIAQIPYMSLSTVFAVAAYGYLDYNLFTRHGLAIGSLFEIILFSLALAYRIKILEMEKLTILEESKNQLELKIQERTKELEESKEKLKYLANTDPLSGLHNRRYLYETAKRLISISKRENKPLCLILFDIDNFKIINDTYGHNIGDMAIKDFSEQLKQHRQSDIAARIGGEEFVLLLPNTTKEQAFILASKIKEERETKAFSNSNINLYFTVSGGISALKEEDKSIEDIISRADEALYYAKNHGRNQIKSN
jgi:two-component system, sensor histidine kinase LadS